VVSDGRLSHLTAMANLRRGNEGKVGLLPGGWRRKEGGEMTTGRFGGADGRSETESGKGNAVAVFRPGPALDLY